MINHKIQNYKARDIINESQAYVLHPGMKKNSVKRFLENYLDMSKEDIDTIFKTKFHQYTVLYINKSYPRFVIISDRSNKSKNKAFILQ